MRRTALITGGSRGIGRACVEAFARGGWDVSFLYLHSGDAAKALEESLRREGLRAAGIRCDVADSAAVREALARIGRIDALVCSAGRAHTGLIQDMSDSQWRDLFAVNVDGAFHCIRAALPGMISRKQGCILLVGSVWGEVGASCEAAYSASKAALTGLTRALAKELGPSGIRVNCVAPGVIDTDMNSRLTPEDIAALCEETPLGRIGSPEEVARAMLFLCGEDAGFITGQVLGVDGGFR